MKNEDKQKKPVNFVISDYQWKNRIVIVSADSKDSAPYRSFRNEWDRKTDEANDRDMILIELFAKEPSMVSGKPIDDISEENLIGLFDIDTSGFEIILIGKDGTVKSKDSEATLEMLFALIDTMPMRQAEIRRKPNQD